MKHKIMFFPPIFSILLMGCGPAHVHSSNVWENDSEKHWHECKDDGTVFDEESHTFGDEIIITNPTCLADGEAKKVCSVCNYEYHYTLLKLNHHVSTEWSTDANHHWHVCDRIGCGEMLDKEAHSYVVKSSETEHWEECSVCGYEKTDSRELHSIITKHDDNNHWQECENCGYEVLGSKKSHTLKEIVDEELKASDKTCLIGTGYYKSCDCGYVSNEIFYDTDALNHDMSTEWFSDETNHWHKCLRDGCSHTEDTDAHTFVAKHDASNHWEECSVCGYEKIDSRRSHSIVTKYDNNHWQECEDCGYEVLGSKKSHTLKETVDEEFKASDKTCLIGTGYYKSCDCGYVSDEIFYDTDALNHDMSNEWFSDETNHWHKCLRDGCSHTEDTEGHTFVVKHDASNHWEECSVCGYEKANSRVEKPFEQKQDGDNHWLECTVSGCEYSTTPETHTFGEWNLSTDYIGLKTAACSSCEYEKTALMDESDINLSDGSAYGSNGSTIVKNEIISEFPMYNESERAKFAYYSDNAAGTTKTLIRLQKVDYSKYSNVVYIFQSNSTAEQFVGLGLSETEDNLISYGNYGIRAKLAVVVSVIDTNSNKIQITGYCGGSSASYEMTDADIISGNKSIDLYAYLGSYRALILDQILLNHDCKEYSKNVKNLSTIGVESICPTCFKPAEFNSENYEVDNLSPINSFGASVISGSGITIAAREPDKGNKLTYGGGQGSLVPTEIALPKINFSTIKNVIINFYANGNSLNIGESSENKITVTDHILIMRALLSGDSLHVFIKSSGNMTSWTIDDKAVIYGTKGIKLCAELPAWNYIGITGIVVNDTVTKFDMFNSSMLDNAFGLSDGESYLTNRGNQDFGGRGFIQSGGSCFNGNTVNDQNLYLPLINFNTTKEVLIQGMMTQGSYIGFSNSNCYCTNAGNGTKEGFTFKFEATDDGKINVTLNVYDCGTNDLHGSANAYESFTNLTCLATKTMVIDDVSIFNGESAISIFFNRHYSWNTWNTIGIGYIYSK